MIKYPFHSPAVEVTGVEPVTQTCEACVFPTILNPPKVNGLSANLSVP